MSAVSEFIIDTASVLIGSQCSDSIHISRFCHELL